MLLKAYVLVYVLVNRSLWRKVGSSIEEYLKDEIGKEIDK